MKKSDSTCGLPNSGWIYFVGLASFVEAIAFTSAYALLIADINRRHIYQVFYNRNYGPPFRVALFLIIVGCFRIFVAFAVVVGRYRKMLSTLAFYIMFTIAGIVCNIVAGAIAVNHRISHDIGVITISIIALHFIYVFIAIVIYRKERKTPRDGPVIQIAMPVDARSNNSTLGTRYVPTLPVLNTPYIQQMPMGDPHMPPPLSPPMYSERDVGSNSYAVESEANPKKTTILK